VSDSVSAASGEPRLPNPLPVAGPVLLSSLLLLALVVWSASTRVEIVVSVPAAAAIQGGNAELRAADAHQVSRLAVAEGAMVAAGDLIVQLDVTVAQARRRSVAQALDDRRLALSRVGSVIRLLEQGLPLGGIDAEVARRVDALRTRRAGLEGDAAALTAEDHALAARQVLLTRLRQISRERVAAAAQAARRQALSRFELLRLQQDDVARLAELDAVRHQRRVLDRRVDAHRARVRELQLDQRQALADEQHALQTEIAELTAALAEAEERRGHGQVRTPVAGVVDVVHVAAGDFVERGTLLGVIVPSGRPVTFEARIPAAQMAFLRAGQRCRLKLDALPFARYGAVPCTVIRLSRDAASADHGGRYYTARVLTDSDAWRIGDVPFDLEPGATGWVDIVTGGRTVLGFVTEPLYRFAAESLRER
jgi:hemolysin D